MFRKIYKALKSLFGISKRAYKYIKGNLDEERIRKVAAFTKKVKDQLEGVADAIDLNADVDSDIEKAIRLALHKLGIIQGIMDESSSPADLIISTVEAIKGQSHSADVQKGIIFNIAKHAIMHLEPDAKANHVQIMLSMVIELLKKKA